MAKKLAGLAAGLFVLALVAAACGTTGYGTTSYSPTLSIVSPSEGATVTGPDVPVSIAVSYFTLDNNAIGKAPEAGKGHWHLVIDGQLQGPVGTAAGVAKGLTPGRHVIKAELHNNDHSALNPVVEKSVTINVR
ncbi:MAG: hypothetical protein HY687_06905 [Chloroflexi bacterium]|nr:hypothetical protein [Chloroflexota bacterium]